MQRQKLFCVLLALCSLATAQAAPLGTAFTYQGRLTDGTNPANGFFAFQFELYDAPTNGTQIGSTIDVDPLQVSNGLFTVSLDFGAGVFTGEARWLEITVNSTVLSPRQPISPAPHALFAPLADGVTAGAITSNMLANGAVTTAKLATGAVTSVTLADTISLGATNVDGRLDVHRTSIGTPAISLLGGANQIRVFSDDGLERTRLDASPGWGQLQLNNSSATGQRAAILTANATGGGSLTLYNSNGQDRAVLFGGNAGGELDLRGSDGLEKVQLAAGSNLGALTLNNNFGNQGAVCLANFFNGGGLLALNSTNGQNRTVLDGGSSGGKMSLFNRNAAATILATADTGSGDPDLSLFNSAGTRTIQVQAGSSQFSTFGSDGLEQIRLWGSSWGEILLFDNVGNNETVTLTSGGDSGGSLTLRTAGGNDRVVIQGQDANGGGAISVRDASGTESVQILGSESGSDGGQIRVKRANGTTSITLDGDFNGEGRITTEALDVSRSIRVPGAGIGTSTPAFVHRVTAANIQPGLTHRTTITHPLTDSDPNAILIVTVNYNPGGGGGILEPNTIGVFYNATLGKWQIFHQDNSVPMQPDVAFNVLVVKR